MNPKLLKELQRRSEAKTFDLQTFCFDKQLAFIQDPARFKTAVCSRRAGKTLSIAAEFMHTCLSEKNVLCLYVTQTARNARNILWPELKRIADDFKIKVKTDDTRMTMIFLDTKSEIRLGGAKDESQIENYRGWKLRKVKVDEGQSFRPYLKYFVNDILMPALRDLRGDLAITGTPGPIPAGAFYDYAHSDLWVHHHWTAFDNPHMKDLELTLAEERAVKGIDETDPGYIRETYGRWMYDELGLVYKFNKDKNIYDKLPDEKLEYIFGVDLGFDDADAIAVIGYSYTSKHVYLIEELVTQKQDITALAGQIRSLQDKYKPVKMVIDSGALGKKIVEELLQRQTLALEAADKHRKFEFIELLNDDLRNSKFKAPAGSLFAQDCLLVQWDRSEKILAQQRLKISDTFHSDICDAVLYAWREARHYLAEPEKPKTKFGTDAWAEEEERKLMEQAARAERNAPDIMGTQEDIDYILSED